MQNLGANRVYYGEFENSQYSIEMNVAIAFLILNIFPFYNRSEMDAPGDDVDEGNKFKKQFK